MDSSRTHRLAHQLLCHDRLSAHFDVKEKKKLPYFQRGLALDKYEGREDVFVSFTSLPKLGINPKTPYDTPAGIYSYPVYYVIENYDPKNGAFTVPFAAEQEYVHVFQVSGIERALHFSYDDNELVSQVKNPSTDLVKPEEIRDIKKKISKVDEFIESTIDEIYSDPPSYLTGNQRAESEAWYAGWIRRLADHADLSDPNDLVAKTILNNIYLSYGNVWKLTKFEGSSDKKQGLPVDSVLVVVINDILQYRSIANTKFPFEDKIREMTKGLSESSYITKKEEVLSERVTSDQAFVWNFTRHLSGFNKSRWTALMRRMGIIGAVDDDTGTIHPNEPTQAVFFDPKSIRVIEVIHNEMPPQYGPGKVNWSFSEWAQNPDKYAGTVINTVINTVASIGRTIDALKANPDAPYTYWEDSFTFTISDIERVCRYAGWLNLHATNNKRWVEEVRPRLLENFQKNKPVGWSKSLERSWDKLVAILRGGRRNR
jgi:hypothetical protein